MNLLDEAKKAVSNIVDDITGVKKDTGPALGLPFTDIPWVNLAAREVSAGLSRRDLFFRFDRLDHPAFRQNLGYSLYIVEKDRVIHFLDFPLNPTSINLQINPAVTGQVMMKGYTEDHNGAPLRQITLTGTSGTLNAEVASPDKSGMGEVENTLRYAFNNTIQAATNTIAQVNRTVNAFKSGTQTFEGPLNYKPTEVVGLTGWDWIHSLERFLDFYLASKKLKANKAWRLVIGMHKDKKYYHCTLGPYSITKPPGTTEYQYNISLTAWRQGRPTGAPSISSNLSFTRDNLSTFNRVVNSIRQARQAIAAAHGVMAGIRADIIESFIVPVGEITLLLKDAVGLTRTTADFAFSGGLMRSLEEPIKTFYKDADAGLRSEIDKLTRSFPGNSLAAASSTSSVSTSVFGSSVSEKEVSGRAESAAPTGDSADPIKKLIEKAPDYPQVFDKMPIDSLTTTPELDDIIEGQMDKVRALNVEDLTKRRETIADFATSISEGLGGGSATFNRVYGLNDVKPTFKKLTVNDIILLKNLNEIVRSIDTMIATVNDQQDAVGEDYYKFYADYAIAQGLRFDTSNISKFFVPFPLGTSLEALAAQYLDDETRWIEIAAINALKAPYIDEDGFLIDVVASAGGDTLTLANSENLYIGQVVEIFSEAETLTKRKIRSIDVLSDIESIVTFDSVENGRPLSAYRPADNATVRAFLPNTVNSNMLIAIPSRNPVTVRSPIKTAPGVEDLTGLATLAKIDFLLDSNGDLVFTSSGDIKVAVGMANLVQAAVMKLRTKKGSLLQWKDYGCGIDAGTSTAEIDAAKILESMNKSFQDDDRYRGVVAAEVVKSGPTLSQNLLVGVNQTDVYLPLTTQIPQ